MATITLSHQEYDLLLNAAEGDDMIVRCQVCDAWLNRDEPACAALEDFTGCWKMATRLPEHEGLCVIHRAILASKEG